MLLTYWTSNSELLLKQLFSLAVLFRPYDDGFNCDQQDAGYGYYADTLNDCKVLFVFLGSSVLVFALPSLLVIYEY